MSATPQHIWGTSLLTQFAPAAVFRNWRNGTLGVSPACAEDAARTYPSSRGGLIVVIYFALRRCLDTRVDGIFGPTLGSPQWGHIVSLMQIPDKSNLSILPAK